MALDALGAGYRWETSLTTDGVLGGGVLEGDLWIVGRGGGDARRLTSFQGVENQPKFSPDGKWALYAAGPTPLKSQLYLTRFPSGEGD